MDLQEALRIADAVAEGEVAGTFYGQALITLAAAVRHSVKGTSKLALRREAAGLTQAETAVLLGVTRTTIAQYETGAAHPPTRRSLKLAKILGCLVEDLFDLEEEE